MTSPVVRADRGERAPRRRVARAALRRAAFVPALVAIIVIRLLAPIIRVRFGRVRGDRIGHLALEPALYRCGLEAVRPARTIDLFWCEGPVANEQLLRMWRRVLPIHPWVRALETANILLPGGDAHRAPWSDRHMEDAYLLAGSEPPLVFTPDETLRGDTELAAIGVPAGTEWVCFIARDPAYLDATLPYDWTAHAFRDADIKSYVSAARQLADRGLAALRMGAVVAEPIADDHPLVIDYATSHRSDFMDVFLFARCRFMISSVSGPCALGWIFKRPIAFVNVAPFLEATTPFDTDTLFIPKSYRRRTTGEPIGLAEIVSSGTGRVGSSAELERAGIEVVQNSADEIAAVALEMDDRIAGRWQTAPEDDELQQRFWEILGGAPDTSHLLRVGAAWLRENRAILDD